MHLESVSQNLSRYSCTGCGADFLGSDVSAWSTALQTNQQQVVREQLIAVQSLVLNAIPGAKTLQTNVSDLVFDIAFNLIVSNPVNRTAASASIRNFLTAQTLFLEDRNMDLADKWFTDRSGNTPVDGYTRFFFDLSFFLFTKAHRDMAETYASVKLLRDKLSANNLTDDQLKMNTVVFFRTLGQREPADSLSKAANALNQFFMKWVSSV